MRMAAVEALGLRTVDAVQKLGALTVLAGRIARAAAAGPHRVRRFVDEIFYG